MRWNEGTDVLVGVRSTDLIGYHDTSRKLWDISVRKMTGDRRQETGDRRLKIED
jgi:hypothetical protein